MVERAKIGCGLFIKAAFVIVVIFIAGLTLGFVLDSFRTSFLSEEMIAANIETESFVVGQMYLADQQDYCKLAEGYLLRVSENVEQLGKDITNLGGKMVFVNNTFIDRRYFLYEIRFWMMFEEYRTRCNRDVDTILFFYGEEGEPSYLQGLALTAIKEKYQDKVMIFSFKHGFKEPALALVEANYNITVVPSIVVNNVVYSRLVEKADIESILSA